MVSIKTSGNFNRLNKYLTKAAAGISNVDLNKYGRSGVAALSAATPFDTGLTSESWYYTITKSSGSANISFHNSNIVDGVPIAVILQYGHGTKNGGYVKGQDYINPAIHPIFDAIAKEAWEEVTSS